MRSTATEDDLALDREQQPRIGAKLPRPKCQRANESGAERSGASPPLREPVKPTAAMRTSRPSAAPSSLPARRDAETPRPAGPTP